MQLKSGKENATTVIAASGIPMRKWLDESGHTQSQIESRWIWVREKGEIPAGYHIHHKGGDPTKNDIDNLMCVSAELHRRIHDSVAEVVTLDGGVRRLCRKCRRVLALSAFRKNDNGEAIGWCLECLEDSRESNAHIIPNPYVIVRNNGLAVLWKTVDVFDLNDRIHTFKEMERAISTAKQCARGDRVICIWRAQGLQRDMVGYAYKKKVTIAEIRYYLLAAQPSSSEICC